MSANQSLSTEDILRTASVLEDILRSLKWPEDAEHMLRIRNTLEAILSSSFTKLTDVANGRYLKELGPLETEARTTRNDDLTFSNLSPTLLEDRVRATVLTPHHPNSKPPLLADKKEQRTTGEPDDLTFERPHNSRHSPISNGYPDNLDIGGSEVVPLVAVGGASQDSGVSDCTMEHRVLRDPFADSSVEMAETSFTGSTLVVHNSGYHDNSPATRHRVLPLVETELGHYPGDPACRHVLETTPDRSALDSSTLDSSALDRSTLVVSSSQGRKDAGNGVSALEDDCHRGGSKGSTSLLDSSKASVPVLSEDATVCQLQSSRQSGNGNENGSGPEPLEKSAKDWRSPGEEGQLFEPEVAAFRPYKAHARDRKLLESDQEEEAADEVFYSHQEQEGLQEKRDLLFPLRDKKTLSEIKQAVLRNQLSLKDVGSEGTEGGSISCEL